MVIAINATFVVPRFQSLTEVPVWEVLQSGADRNHGALGGREIHLNEHSGWIQVRVPKFKKVKGLEPCSHYYETKSLFLIKKTEVNLHQIHILQK